MRPEINSRTTCKVFKALNKIYLYYQKERKIMANNWTAAKALETIRKGTNKEAIADIARRFPLFAIATARCAS